MNTSSSFSKKDISQISTYQSGVAQAAAHRLINRVVTDYLLAYGLTPMQWFAIGYIYDAGRDGMRVSDLARTLGTTLPYITNKIIVLESKGLVRKVTHKGDSRIKMLTISPSYASTVKEIEAGLRERLRNELYSSDNISRDELQTYIKVLYKIINGKNIVV